MRPVRSIRDRKKTDYQDLPTPDALKRKTNKPAAVSTRVDEEEQEEGDKENVKHVINKNTKQAVAVVKAKVRKRSLRIPLDDEDDDGDGDGVEVAVTKRAKTSAEKTSSQCVSNKADKNAGDLAEDIEELLVYKKQYMQLKELRVTDSEKLLQEYRAASKEKLDASQKLIEQLQSDCKSMREQFAFADDARAKLVLAQKELEQKQGELDKTSSELFDMSQKLRHLQDSNQLLALLQLMSGVEINKIDPNGPQPRRQSIVQNANNQAGLAVKLSIKNPKDGRMAHVQLIYDDSTGEVDYQPLQLVKIVEQRQLPEYLESDIVFDKEDAPFLLAKLLDFVFSSTT